MKIFLLSVLCLLSSLLCFSLHAEEERPVFLMEIAGTIDPAVARYVTRGLEQARRQQAGAVVLRLNTSGGSVGSLRKIIRAILNSPVPVLAHVAPDGARAVSGGVLILRSAHVAVMAPGTSLGDPSSLELGEGMDEKLRGREVDWVAADLEDLLRQTQGRLVKTIFGVSTLSLLDQPRVSVSMSVMEKGLHRLASPNVAYLLLLLGIGSLMYELSAPRAIFPGLIGILLLVPALAALQMLEVPGATILWVTLGTVLIAVLVFKRKATA